jgi:hypothetical protein
MYFTFVLLSITLIFVLGFYSGLSGRVRTVHLFTLTLREEHRLRVFENRMLRRIFGLKGDKVTGGWRKLHNEELHNLYSLPVIIRMIKLRRMRWTGHLGQMGSNLISCTIYTMNN